MFHDTLISFWRCSANTIECEIERQYYFLAKLYSFEITKEMFAEMRRNKSLMSRYRTVHMVCSIFLKSGEFSQFHLVNFLETIRSRTYCYLLP